MQSEHDNFRLGVPKGQANLVFVSLWLFFLAAIVNIGFGLAVGFAGNLADLEADEAEYVGLATNLLDGHIVLDGRRTLGFPFLLSLLMRVSPNLGWLQVATSLIYSVSIPLFFILVRRHSGDQRIGMIAAVLLLLWPPALFYGNSLYSESAAMPFLVLLLLTLPSASAPTNRNLVLMLLAGVTVAILTHLRPMYLLAVPVVLLAIAIEGKNLRQSLLNMAAVCMAFLAVMLPWSFTVSRAIDRPVLATASAGETMAGGLNPKLVEYEGNSFIKLTDRDAWVGPGKWVDPIQTGFVTDQETQLPYAQLSKLLSERCLAWVSANPVTAAYLEIRKLAYMWGIYPGPANGMKQFVMGNVPIVALLLWAAICIWKSPTSVKRHARFLLLPVFVSGVALISWGSWRFRLPGDVGLIVFCTISSFEIYRAKLSR